MDTTDALTLAQGVNAGMLVGAVDSFNRLLLDYFPLLVFSSAVLLLYAVQRRSKKYKLPLRGEWEKMSARERELAIRRLIGDGLTDVIEAYEFEGVLTREEADKWYSRCANIFSIDDLLPKKFEGKNLRRQFALKKAAKKRIKTMRETGPLPLPEAPHAKAEPTEQPKLVSLLKAGFTKAA